MQVLDAQVGRLGLHRVNQLGLWHGLELARRARFVDLFAKCFIRHCLDHISLLEYLVQAVLLGILLHRRLLLDSLNIK